MARIVVDDVVVSEADRPIEQQLVWLRWAVIVSLAYLILIGRSGLVTRPSSLMYVGLLLASNLVVSRLPYRHPEASASALLALDTILIPVGVLLSDSSSQELMIGYFLCMLMATFGDSERRIAGTALLVVGIYSASILRSSEAASETALLIRLPFLFITTVFFGFMMRRIQREHERCMQKSTRQYESLLEIERTRSEFLVNLSHELRTPLSVVMGFSELAAEQCRDHPNRDLSEMISRISRNASRLNDRVETLLRLSQLTLGHGRREHGRVDLPALLHRVLDNARHSSPSPSVGVELDVEPGLSAIYTDGEKLEQVVESLVSNAVKFTRAGSVRVAAALVNGNAIPSFTALPNGLQPGETLLSLIVRDTGIGIASGDLRKIFQDFTQGNGGVDRPYEGLGIGLSLATRLTELLGGVIRVDSELDKGSVFEVLVPVQAA